MKYVYKNKLLILFATIFDAIGYIIAWSVRKMFPSKVPDQIRRILVIRLDHIGDVVLASSVIAPVREAFPDARIDFMVSSAGGSLIEGNDTLDSVIKFDPVWFRRNKRAGLFAQIRDMLILRKKIKEGQYDVAIDLRGDLRHIVSMFLAGTKCRIGLGITGGGFMLTHERVYDNSAHEIDQSMGLLKFLGIENKDAKPDICVDTNLKGILRDNGVEGAYAVFHLVPGHKTKVWDYKDFIEVLSYVTNTKGIQCVIVGSLEDAQNKISTNENICNLLGKTNLEELAAILSGAEFFVGADSGPAHIAACTGIPTIILFSGVNNPEQWAPKGDNVHIIYPGKGKDLSSISPEDVIEEINKLSQDTKY